MCIEVVGMAVTFYVRIETFNIAAYMSTMIGAPGTIVGLFILIEA